jgi:hypothetical protein
MPHQPNGNAIRPANANRLLKHTSLLGELLETRALPMIGKWPEEAKPMLRMFLPDDLPSQAGIVATVVLLCPVRQLAKMY